MSEVTQQDKLLCPFCESSFALDAWMTHLGTHDGATDKTVSGDLPLDLIRTDFGTQSRVHIDTPTVQRYASEMREGDQFPAIKVWYDPQQQVFVLVDGFHRLQAAKVVREEVQRETFSAIIQIGTVREAVLASKGVNPHHGLQRTAADKRKVVTDMLQDPDWAKWADREIARHCHVSHTLVSAIRGELTPRAAGGTASTPARTYNRNGQTQTMNTSRITSSNRARTLPPAVGRSEDDYHDEVPAVDVDQVGAGAAEGNSGSTSGTNPSPLPPSGHRVVWTRGEPAKTPPGMTPASHYDPMTGAHPVGLNGGKAPVVPALLGKLPWSKCAEGDHWNIRDAQGATILVGTVAGELGEKIAMMIVEGANAAQAAAPEAQPTDDSLPFVQIRELGLDKHIDELNQLIKTHGKDKVAAVLRYLREVSYVPENPLEYIESRLVEIKGTKPKRKKPERSAEENQHIQAIIAAYIAASKTLDKSIYNREVIRKAALEMWEANIRPEHIALYGKENTYWTGKWDTMRTGIVRWLDNAHPGWRPPESKPSNVLELPAEFYQNLRPASGATGGGK